MFGKKLPDPFICTGYVISDKIFRHPVQYVVKFECDMYCTYVQPFMYSSVMWPIPSFGVCCRVCHAELVHFKLYCTLLTCSILWNMSLHCGWYVMLTLYTINRTVLYCTDLFHPWEHVPPLLQGLSCWHWTAISGQDERMEPGNEVIHLISYKLCITKTILFTYFMELTTIQHAL